MVEAQMLVFYTDRITSVGWVQKMWSKVRFVRLWPRLGLGSQVYLPVYILEYVLLSLDTERHGRNCKERTFV